MWLIVEALVGSAIDATIGVVAGLATGYVAWLVGMPFRLKGSSGDLPARCASRPPAGGGAGRALERRHPLDQFPAAAV